MQIQQIERQCVRGCFGAFWRDWRPIVWRVWRKIFGRFCGTRKGRQTADFQRSGTRPCSMDVILKKLQWDGESLASSSVYGQGRGT